MTEEDKSYTSVLLPGAHVTLFTDDEDTDKAFHELESDWRFARVSLETRKGGVDVAISHYSSSASPELIIIQTEDINDGFTDKLETLAGYLSENTAAIVIGPVNDVNLYRKLLGMGVSDYLVKPITSDLLGHDIAATLIESKGAADSRLIAVMGAKGGVGATTLVEALAWHVSGDLKQKTFLLDAAGGWSSLSVGMDFEPSTTLAEAGRAAAEGSEDSLTRMIHKASDKLFVLSSGGDVMLDDSVAPEQYEALLEYLMGLYPVVLVDLSCSPADLKRTVLARAHLTLLVTTPILPSVRAARTLMNEIKQLRGGIANDVEIVLNMHGLAPKYEVPKAQIQEGLEKAPAVVIPFDPDMFIATESEAGKLGDHKNGGAVVQNLLQPVRALLSLAESKAVDGGSKKAGIGQLLTKLKAKS